MAYLKSRWFHVNDQLPSQALMQTFALMYFISSIVLLITAGSYYVLGADYPGRIALGWTLTFIVLFGLTLWWASPLAACSDLGEDLNRAQEMAKAMPFLRAGQLIVYEPRAATLVVIGDGSSTPELNPRTWNDHEVSRWPVKFPLTWGHVTLNLETLVTTLAGWRGLSVQTIDTPDLARTGEYGDHAWRIVNR